MVGRVLLSVYQRLQPMDDTYGRQFVQLQQPFDRFPPPLECGPCGADL